MEGVSGVGKTWYAIGLVATMARVYGGVVLGNRIRLRYVSAIHNNGLLVVKKNNVLPQRSTLYAVGLSLFVLLNFLIVFFSL